ncbi:hypothetical protein K2173_011852 [Erythroxylum novogranatense]|uniref:Cytochrome P450 n=1 Tax=Erythroxylum novogranatense TaxID=1862640 RepID=A0AAV8S757_9ROSI|nr:hypothetical protein K2173_011852 [Erythroxylum novogranatense]
MLYLFLLVVLFLLPAFYLLYLFNREELNLPPSPPELPIIGNLYQVGKLPHRSFQALSWAFNASLFWEGSDKIMKTHDLAFRPQAKALEVITYQYRDLAFCPYGEYWKQVRKICVVELLSQKRVQSFQFVREQEVAKLVEKIKRSCLDGAVINLSRMLLSVSNNMISRTALGRVYEEESGKKNFGDLAKGWIDLLGSLCFKDTVPSLGWMDVLSGFNARLDSTFRALDEFLDQVIEQHRESENYDEQDFVNILLRLQKDGSLGLDLTPDNIKAILMSMFVGGTDTTAATLEWAMAELVRNPSIMRKAQEEIRRVAGEKSEVCESDVNEMSFLKCIMKESIRLHSVAIIMRETRSTAKLGGYDIPRKTRVLISTWGIHRDPNVWDKPEEFIPERFADSSIDFLDGQLMPFGGGRRVCPGMRLAIAEMECVLANLLYWFDWELPNGEVPQDLDMSEVNSVVIRKKAPLLLMPRLHSP